MLKFRVQGPFLPCFKRHHRTKPKADHPPYTDETLFDSTGHPPLDRAGTRLFLFFYLLLILLLSLMQIVTAYAQSPSVLTGKITDPRDQPLTGATVSIRQIGRSTQTGPNGTFRLSGIPPKGILEVSYIGFKPKTLSYDTGNSTNLLITLDPDKNSLDEVQVIAYGSTSRRYNTGSVVSVKQADIERQPLSNPLASLAGQVPGMTVTPANGNPGSGFNIRIRGQNSISQGSEPLFLIDGVPFPNTSIGPAGTFANAGQSPLANINPLDIQSIEILKDADATAIYGSRGAGGVVLITTKKGRAGATTAEASVYQAAGNVPKTIDLLNKQQYLAMRKEAFHNDGIQPTALNAPDLMLWDTTRSTDWQHYLIGGTAHTTNANVALSGGNERTIFHASGGYNQQGSVYPGDYQDRRGNAGLNVSHTSSNNRFKALLSAAFSTDKNELPGNDLTSSMMLPPDNPPLFNADGSLNWQENGGTFSNPLTYLKRKTYAATDNFLSNVNLQYQLLEGLTLRTTGGFNLIQFNRLTTNPISAQNPNTSGAASESIFSYTTSKSFILEPQLEYTRTLGKTRLDVLAGATLQDDIRSQRAIEATGFPNEALMEAAAFASRVTAETSTSEYRYQAAFGRITLNYDGRYLLNLSGRRDGSSRFGPDRRVANFGAIGAAWIFSEDLKEVTPTWLSFGKLRGSYGVTGNDQIGDYQYLDDYTAVRYAYQGSTGYVPSRLYNADYTWERNKKLEAALELGFLDDRIQFTASWFRNRSNNQLINYKLPAQTGFSGILRNFEALVQNSGWEGSLSARPLQQPRLNWTVSANITLQRNKLLEFPGLEASSYANSLVIGKPLNIVKLLDWTGVDPQTGIYMFTGTSRPADQTVIADLSPKYTGGLNNSFSCRNWEFSFLLQFTKQKGYSYLTNFSGQAPGTAYNQPLAVWQRWQQAGEETSVQKFSTTGAAVTAFSNYAGYSDARITDASFLRLKNLYLGYTLPRQALGHAGLQGLTLFLQGQNLLTLTGYKGLDPEMPQAPYGMPSLRVLSFGTRITL